MTNKRVFIDVHAIQTLPPSNINRDDTGSPKTAQYGGVTRARVSSQSWKKAMRDYFNCNGDVTNVGVRTLEIVSYVAKKIIELKPDLSMEDAMKLSDKIWNVAKVKTKNQKAKALFFLGDIQAEKLAKAAIEGITDKKEIQKILQDNPAVDIALFGRMVADDPSLNEDASAQVAHSISTHGVQTEFDFYTAVDDQAPEDNAGAGMLGTIEFNSSTLYRYANISVHELNRQLKDTQQVINTIKLFVESFVRSMPTGKVNTFANQTIPDAVMVTIRSDRPINLVTAFEEPVRSEKGFVDQSIKRLIDEYKNVQKIVKKPVCNYLLTLDQVELEEGQGHIVENLSEMMDYLDKDLNELINE